MTDSDPAHTAPARAVVLLSLFAALPACDSTLLESGGSSRRDALAFTQVDPAGSRRTSAAMVLLNDGSVLLAGGAEAIGVMPAAAEVFDPRRGAWRLVGELQTPRAGASAVLLHDGTALVIGGRDADGNVLASTERYDPRVGQWTAGPNLNVRRMQPTALVLPDGRVLVAGGRGCSAPGPCCGTASSTCATTSGTGVAPSLASSELYDPGAGAFAPTTGSMSVQRYDFAAVTLADGSVLAIGGFERDGVDNDPDGVTASVDLFDASSGSWTACTHGLNTARARHTATRLAVGGIAIVGGTDTGRAAAASPVVEWLTLDENSGAPVVGCPSVAASAPTLTGALGRWYHSATRLPDDRVLIYGGLAGGSDVVGNGGFGGGPEMIGQLLDFDAQWAQSLDASLGGPPSRPRFDHTAALLSTGEVLFAAGHSNFGPLAEVELFDPTDPRLCGVAPMPVPRTGASIVALLDGRVLVAFGRDDGGAVADFTLFEPGQVSFPCDHATGHGGWTTPTATGFAARSGAPAHLLIDGSVLFVGGLDDFGAVLASEPVVRLDQGDWTSPSAGFVPRAGHSLTELADGRLLVVGGHSADGSVRADYQIYDPFTRSWSDTTSITGMPSRHLHAASLLRDGRVLISGGAGEHPAQTALASAVIFDPATGEATPVEDLETPRWGHASRLLPESQATALFAAGDRVLAAFGDDGNGAVGGYEVYDLASESWLVRGDTVEARSAGHALITLHNGKLLALGGVDVGAAVGEVFDPQLLDSGQPNLAWRSAAGLASAPLVATPTPAPLPNGQWLVAGGLGDAVRAAADVVDLGLRYPEEVRPRPAFSQLLTPGERLLLPGQGLLGPGEAGSGLASRHASTQVPVVQLTRVSDGVQWHLPLLDGSFDDDQIELPLPAALPDGSYRMIVLAAAIPSLGVIVSIVGERDECALGTHNCAPEATCADLRLGFACRCVEGFVGDGLVCDDVDECSDGAATCDVNASCVNLPGDYACECDEGWHADGTSCVGLCGDGVVVADEICDDGNLSLGDGCDADCEVEPDWRCDSRMPTRCEPVPGAGGKDREGCGCAGAARPLDLAAWVALLWVLSLWRRRRARRGHAFGGRAGV